VAGLLRPHSAALTAHLQGGDLRVIELVRICAELADDVGVAFGEADRVPLHRDDYALAAGADMGRHGSTAIATGADSVNWGARPGSSTRRRTPSRGASRRPKASRRPLCAWSCRAPGWPPGSPCGCGPAPLVAMVCSTPTASRRSRSWREKRPVTESAAWDHDWRSTVVTVGVDLKESVESPQTRERIRDFSRARLRGPAGDAFLAEVLAAESDY
jgi:hypothetical protein